MSKVKKLRKRVKGKISDFIKFERYGNNFFIRTNIHVNL